MWKSVKIKNFQIHKNLELDLKYGVNIIAGSSDSGKSSLIRAIVSLLTNKNFSSDYATWGSEGEEMEVTIETDSNIVSRFREGKKNGYRVNGKEFIAIRNQVPTEVSDLFHVSDVNIGNQYEPFFLLSSSSGEVARRIQDFCDLSLIQKTIHRADCLEKEAKVRYRNLNEEKTRIDEELESMSWIETCKASLSSIQKKKKRLDKLSDDIQKLNEVIQKDRKISALKLKFLPVLRYEENFQILEARAQKLEEKKKYYRLLLNVYDKAIKRREEIEANRKIIKLLAFEKPVAELLGEFNAQQEKKKQILEYKHILEKYHSIRQQIQTFEKTINELEKEEHEVKKQIKICPTCGQEMTK